MKVTKQPTTKATPSELVALVDSLRGQVADLENTLQSSDGTRELLENIQDGILVIDAATHRIREINPMAATMFGAPRQRVQGHECFEFICPAQRGACPVTDLGVAVDHAERQMVTKGGGRKPILKTVARMTLGGDDVLVESFMDISEQKEAEEALRALALRHDALLAAIPEIVMEVDNDKVYTWANQAGQEFFGEDVVGKEAASFFEGEQKTYETVEPVFKGSEGTVYVESWQRRRDGEKRLLAWWCRTLKDESGNVTGALSSAHDITERKAVEETLASAASTVAGDLRRHARLGGPVQREGRGAALQRCDGGAHGPRLRAAPWATLLRSLSWDQDPARRLPSGQGTAYSAKRDPHLPAGRALVARHLPAAAGRCGQVRRRCPHRE